MNLQYVKDLLVNTSLNLRAWLNKFHVIDWVNPVSMFSRTVRQDGGIIRLGKTLAIAGFELWTWCLSCSSDSHSYNKSLTVSDENVGYQNFV